MGQNSSHMQLLAGARGVECFKVTKIVKKCHFALFYAFLGPFWLQVPTVPQNGQLKPENVDRRPFFDCFVFEWVKTFPK